MKPRAHPTNPILQKDRTVALCEREQLRRDMRARRRAVTTVEQKSVAAALATIISRRQLLRPGRRIAVYLRHGREADLSEVITLARHRGCRLYLPAITSAHTGRMEFVRFDTTRKLRRNLFGILEPDLVHAERVAVRELDFVLLPLVAVDARGWRLGSGAGFYDRRLNHLKTGRRWRRPRLIGIAYEFQRVALIEPETWDVPLDAVVTERGFYPTCRAAIDVKPQRHP